MFRPLFLILIFQFIYFSGIAQMGIASMLGDSLIQANYLNPASPVSEGWNISLPSANFGISQIGPKYGDVLVKNDEGVNTFDAEGLLINSVDNNIFQTHVSIQTLGVFYRKKRSTLGISHFTEFHGIALYPEELTQLYARGNAQFIGETVAVGPEFQFTTAHRYALSYNYALDKFSFGARINLHSGVADVSTDGNQLLMTTDDDIYRISFESDYRINSHDALQLSDLSDVAISLESVDYSEFISRNLSLSFDFGLTARINDQLEVSMSYLGLGSYQWKDNSKQFFSEGISEYDGVDIVSLIRDTSSIVLEDSLYQLLEFEEVTSNYSSSMRQLINLNVAHSISDGFKLNYLFQMEKFRSQSIYSFGLANQFDLTNNLLVSLQYLYRTDNVLNIGVSGILDLGPLRLFAISDNVLGLFSIKKAGFGNVSIGANLKL